MAARNVSEERFSSLVVVFEIYPNPRMPILQCEQEKSSHLARTLRIGRNMLLQTPAVVLLKGYELGKSFAVPPCARNLPPALARLEYVVMQGRVKEEWMQLCEQATIEQDSDRLMVLIKEINRMLDEKEQRLKSGQPSKAPTDGEIS
jgi:hypothetical protein